MDLLDNVQAEYAKHEQIIFQFCLKSLHIILESRVPSIRPSGHSRGMQSTSVKKSDKWFSLVLGDCPAALNNLNIWGTNLMEPIIIDIILVQEVQRESLTKCNPSSLGLGNCVETIIERWVVRYEHRKLLPQSHEFSASCKRTYKKSIILLRSLYSIMRLLPAYQAFQKLCSSSQVSDFDIKYKVSSFRAPFARMEEEVMKQYYFTPVKTPQGSLSISLSYHENLSDFNLNTHTSFLPQLITDYVGSPATNPFRAFPSLQKGVHATPSSVKGVQSPCLISFQQPHTWTSGGNRVFPSMQAPSGVEEFSSGKSNHYSVRKIFSHFLYITSSENLAEGKGSEVSSKRESQDTAIGDLIHMLITAPPLRQDSSCCSLHSKTRPKGEAAPTSGIFMPRKASDALEDLRDYKAMKDLLLSRCGMGLVNEER
ncbi:hypothetical protein NMG60_11020014 [Bertholletia excelsa]